MWFRRDLRLADLTALQAAAAEMVGETAVFAANAGDVASADACVRATIERFGGLDIIVNNAGSRRRQRRTQNCRRFTPPARSRSSISKEVIRNPETTKKTSTPKKPPCIHENPA